MEALGSLAGSHKGPHEAFPDGTHYEYDSDLKRTVEVGPSGERFLVALITVKLRREALNSMDPRATR